MKKTTLALALALALASCTDNLTDDSHYAVPSWLKGNAYEVLQSYGNYSSFLRGVELCGSKEGVTYSDILKGKILVTVMAPDDDAFKTYLSTRGYSSIDEMYAAEPDYTEKLIKFHLMYYAFDWNKMVNFRPNEGDGATDEQKAENAGYYYKHRTYSRDNMEYVAPDTILYHYDRYLPIFSNMMFDTKGIDAASNYEYFFPETEWKYGSKATGYFNIANASMMDSASIVTDNGYLYRVSRVLEPMETIYTYLQNNNDYSDFLEIYDKYAYYTVDQEQSTNTGLTVYTKHFTGLPDIAMEWPTTDWKNFATLEKNGYNIFAPSNEAMKKFFANYWTEGCGYTSLKDLDSKIQEYFLKQSFGNLEDNANFLVFPEEIKDSLVRTTYGTLIKVNPDEVNDRVMCSNGTFYGMDDMEAPAIFSSVVGPAFKDIIYLPYLYTLDGCGMILSLASDNSQFVTLMPDTAQYTAAQMRLYQTVNGKELQVYSDEAGDYVKMSSSQEMKIVNMHTAAGVGELKATGNQVVESNAVFNYWFVKDGKLTTSSLFNEQLNENYEGTPWMDFHEITNNGKAWDNGRSYAYDYKEGILEEAAGDGLAYKLAICNDARYPYYLFAQLLQKAGLAGSFKSDTETWTGLSTTIQSRYNGEVARFVTFIPTNEAIRQSIKSIPGCSKLSIDANYKITGNPTKSQLADYLMTYFITSSYNAITTYPYLGSAMNGIFKTESMTKEVDIKDDGKVLYVKYADSTGDYVKVNDKYDYFPFAFSDGCFHLIDDILR